MYVIELLVLILFLFSFSLVLFCFVFVIIIFFSGGGLLLFVCSWVFFLFCPANCNASAESCCIVVRGSDACALIGTFVQNWVASILGDFGANNQFTWKWKWRCFHCWVSQNSSQTTSRKTEDCPFPCSLQRNNYRVQTGISPEIVLQTRLLCCKWQENLPRAFRAVIISGS